jgi:hypothetical protein
MAVAATELARPTRNQESHRVLAAVVLDCIHQQMDR